MATKYGGVVVSEHSIGSEDDRLEHSADREDAPLLTPSSEIESRQQSSPAASLGLQIRIIAILSISIILIQGGVALHLPAMIAIIREKLCAEHDVMLLDGASQDLCAKNPDVERQLAYILGMNDFLACIPMLLLSSLYGSFADRYGRRFILFLSVLGLFLQFSWMTFVVLQAPKIGIRLLLLGPIFTIIGGGGSVAVAILFTISGDVIPSEHKASVFSFIQATSVAGSLIGAALSSVWMLRFGNTVPLLIGLGLFTPCAFLVPLLPDTQKIALSQPETSMEGLVIEDTRSTASLKMRETAGGTFLQSLQDLVKAPGSVAVLVASFFSLVGQPNAFLVFQYIPYNFGLGVAQANFLNVWQYALSLFVLFALVPVMNAWMLRKNYSVFRKDKRLACIFCGVFLVGSLILTLAPNLVIAVIGLTIWSCGAGMGAALRSVYLEVLPPEEAAFATTIISLVKSIGGTMAGPLCSAVFALSLRWQNFMGALPMFVITLCFVVSAFALRLVRKPYQRDLAGSQIVLSGNR